MKHIIRPAYTVAAVDMYWCEGWLHRHRTERAALSCESRRNAPTEDSDGDHD